MSESDEVVSNDAPLTKKKRAGRAEQVTTKATAKSTSGEMPSRYELSANKVAKKVGIAKQRVNQNFNTTQQGQPGRISEGQNHLVGTTRAAPAKKCSQLKEILDSISVRRF